MCELSNKIFSTPTILIFPSMPHIRWASVSRLVWNHTAITTCQGESQIRLRCCQARSPRREYEEALTWLTDYGIITKVPCLDALHIPLTGYESLNTFKIYLEDTGILGALSGLDVNTLVNKSKLFSDSRARS